MIIYANSGRDYGDFSRYMGKDVWFPVLGPKHYAFPENDECTSYYAWYMNLIREANGKVYFKAIPFDIDDVIFYGYGHDIEPDRIRSLPVAAFYSSYDLHDGELEEILDADILDGDEIYEWINSQR